MERKELIYNTLYRAAKESFASLVREYPERYYYAALIMLDAQFVCITAMSEETLAQSKTGDRWSYGDSPYTGYAHKTFFADADTLFHKDIWDTELTDEVLEARIADWQSIMLSVMQTLSENGTFAAYPDIFLNAEAYPPEVDYNYRNAQTLNKPAIFKRWAQDNKPEIELQISAMWEEWHPTMCSVVLVKPLPSKKLAVTLRKEFSSPLSLSEFLKGCEAQPFPVSEEFRYQEAQKILSENPEYAECLSVTVLPPKTEALPQ